MTPDAVERAAALLIEARRNRRPIDGLPADCRPSNLVEGYLIQSAFRSRWPDRLAGWKIGATAKPIMERFGTTEPFMGPIFAEDVAVSPAALDTARFNQLVIESEFAYRLGKNLPARTAPYAREEILAAVDAVIPAFELVSCRYEKLPLDNAPAAIADCGVNGALVLGAPIADWRAYDLPRQAVRLTVDGVVKAEGSGAAPLGDPRNVLDWAVNKLSQSDIGLEKGQVLSTGTCTGVVLLEKGQTAVADFGPLGRIEARFV